MKKPSAYDPRKILGMAYEGEKFVDTTVQSGKQICLLYYRSGSFTQ